MKSVSYDEAYAVLSTPRICPDVQDWWYDKLQPNLARCESGLIDVDGSRSGYWVQILFADPPKTRLIEFKFTVFRLQLAARQRIYQLHVNRVARAPKNWHDLAHEHIGDRRFDGEAQWLQWNFLDALGYFCHRTNITFAPPIADPSVFELRTYKP